MRGVGGAWRPFNSVILPPFAFYSLLYKICEYYLLAEDPAGI